MRRHHGVKFSAVRSALDYVRRKRPLVRHPLAETDLATDGLDSFVEEFGRLIAASQSGQQRIRDNLTTYLRRVDRDPTGLALRLRPFTRPLDAEQPKRIEINARVAFGRPVLAGSGIRTQVIVQRFKAGETFETLADDYARDVADIEEAIRWELPEAA